MIRIDARELAPPEPFERVIAALSRMPAGEEVLLILDREPVPLYRFLQANGYAYATQRFPDGRVEVSIREQTPGERGGGAAQEPDQGPD